MAAGIGLVVKIAGETRQAVADIKDVNRALEGTGTETRTANKMLSGLKGPATAALAAVAGAALAAGAAMIEFGKAAWEDHQEAERLAYTLQKIPGITQELIDANEAWITQTMFATHVLDTDLRQAISDLTVATGDLSQAQKLATLAADVATATDQEYSSVVDQLTKAVGGKTTALMRNMPWLDANEDGTLTLTEAVDGLTGAYGGAAAEAAKTDPWTTIQLIFDELKESLGQWILPLFERLGDWFADERNQAKIQEFISKIGDLAYKVGEKLLPYLEDFLDWLSSPEGEQQIKEWIGLLKDVAAAFGRIVDEIIAVMGWLKKANDAIAKFNPLVGKVGANGYSAAPSGAQGLAPAAAAGAMAYRSGPTIVFNGLVTDPEGTARAVSRVLTGSDRRNARPRSGAPQW